VWSQGPSDEGVLESLDMASKFGYIKTRKLKDYAIEVLSQPRKLNVTDYQGDNRIRKLLPVLYKKVEYKPITIQVPVDATDSDLGLPDFRKIARKVAKSKQTGLELVGSTSVLEFRDII